MKKLFIVLALCMLLTSMAWGVSASVTLRPTHIDISTADKESAVLVTLSGYASNDARYRLYSESYQYYCWDEATDVYITSNSYASGPLAFGTPTSSTTFWILFKRGSNASVTASYRDRIPPYTGTGSANYQTAALPAATSITAPFALSGTYTGDSTVKHVVLGFNGTTLVSASSTSLITGAFSLTCPTGATIDNIEIRSVDNSFLASLTGAWTTDTADITITPSGTPLASTPTIIPPTGNYFSPFNATITCPTENATIYYSTNGLDPDNNSDEYTDPISITGYTVLKAIAYADGYLPSPVATATYTFPVINDVADIAELRAGATDGTVYRLTGEAVLTFQQTITGKPKWVQDNTAAIYLYDTSGKITTTYNVGDGITGIIGTLTIYYGLLELIPVADPGVATSTGNVVIPEVRTLASLTSADQSKLIKVENVTLDTASGNFGTSAQNINATQGATTLTMRTFASTDYSSTPIPSTPQTITCLVGEFTTGIQISPRFLADFEETFDYPAGTPISVGDETITITGGSANNGVGDIPGVTNVNFTLSTSFVLTLIGAGPWTITIETTAPWGAYYQNGEWHPVEASGGSITFVITAAKDLIVPIVLGDEDPTLPVELSSFTATITTDLMVKIAWIAQSETNHSGYNVLRAELSDLTSAIRINPSLIDNGTNLGTQISYSYTDNEAYSNMQYYYWLESVALDGVCEYYGPLSVTIGDPNLDPLPPAVPLATKLLYAFPNPFNPNTNLRYSLREAGKVNIGIYNVKGQLIRSFSNEHNAPGYYQVNWDGRDASGQPVSSGIYLYRMSSGKYTSSKKMILAK